MDPWKFAGRFFLPLRRPGNYYGVYFTNEYLDTYRRNDPNIVLISSIVIGDRCAHNLDKLLVPHGSIGLDAGLAEDLVNCNNSKRMLTLNSDCRRVGEDTLKMYVRYRYLRAVSSVSLDT